MSIKENNMTKIIKSDDCLYLIDDLWGMDTYDRSKAIVNFCDKETKRFEKEIDMAIIDIFERNGINIPNTEKSVLKKAFAMLKEKKRTIDIVDLLEDVRDYNVETIRETKNHFTVVLEDKRYLQCGVQVVERKLV